MDFPRIKRLPPYVFNAIGELCIQARRAGEPEQAGEVVTPAGTKAEYSPVTGPAGRSEDG